MKRIIFAVLAYVIVTLPSFAILTTDEATSQNYIINHGYSPETARMMDLQHSQITGEKKVFKSSDPDWYTTNKAVYFVRRVFMYFDCGLDNGNFGKEKINPSPRYDDL